MYISPWPGLRARDLFTDRSASVVPYPLNHESLSFYVARSGIFHLFRALRLQPHDTVLVPDYHSGNEVAAMRAAGASLTFYPIRRNLEPDLDALSQLAKRLNPRIIYVIHYLGWPQPIREIQRLCLQQGSVLVEDCALALLSETEGKPLGTFGDHSIFCLYKTLPVPNGGLLVQNGNANPQLSGLALERCPKIATIGRSAELLLETLRTRMNGIGKALSVGKRAIGRLLRGGGARHLPVGDIGWDAANVSIGMSRISQVILKSLDYAEVKRKRRDNFLTLRRLLNGDVNMLREDLPDGACPLFFPILVKDKRMAAEALHRRGIGAVEFWNDALPGTIPGPDARYLREHVLELPVHQDVTPPQLRYIANQVCSLNLEPCPR